MKIAIIGVGNIGRRLATKWAEAGYEILLGTRDVTDSEIGSLLHHIGGNISVHGIKEAVALADVITLAVGYKNLPEVLATIGQQPNKLIIETINGAFDGGHAPAQQIEAALGSDRIVKAFNTVGAEILDNPDFDGTVADSFICGDHKEDKQLVTKLVQVIGFQNVYDIGGLEKENLLEQVALFWGALAYGAGLGRSIAFKILVR